MVIENWLSHLQNDNPELSDFIDKLKPYMSDNGFNGVEFERKVNLGLLQASKEIDLLFNTTDDVTDK